MVNALIARGHSVSAVARRAPAEPYWPASVTFTPLDVHDAATDPVVALGVPEVLVHLAWPGLPNYRELFHVEQNLPDSYRFIKRMVAAGTKHVLVTGTCFEYGMQQGPLSEELPTQPGNAYGLAKDTLRRFLQALQTQSPFVLQWARLFYLHGPGQAAGSVLAQLDRAIDAGESHFNMSGGEQLRDYLSVDEAVRYLAVLIERPDFDGVVNCCSGRPISIRRLVEERITQRGAHIGLNLGHFPYTEHEPFAFWGVRNRLDQLLGQAS